MTLFFHFEYRDGHTRVMDMPSAMPVWSRYRGFGIRYADADAVCNREGLFAVINVGTYSYGLHSYGLHGYGLCSYGLYSRGPYGYGHIVMA